jgi:hypothetical protein
MEGDKDKLYQALFAQFIKAHPEKCKKECQKEVIKLWNEIKNDEDFPKKYEQLLKSIESTFLKKKGTLLKFWATSMSKSTEPKTDNVTKESPTIPPVCPKKPQENFCTPTQKPVQDKLNKDLGLITGKILALKSVQTAGLLTQENEKELNDLQAQKIELERTLKIKIGSAERQKKYRENRKREIGNLITQNPDISKKMRVFESPGRPRLEVDQPEILKAICDIALFGSAAHDRRQNEVIRTVKTLDQLNEELKRIGFSISRTGTYLRLVPKKQNSTEGMRHVVTAPVKLVKAQNDSHKDHIDGKFCSANIGMLEELASVLGPQQVCFLSQDDKARVALGLPAANKQSPILMHMQYRITLPDHDWVVAPGHKLIPSVYAGIIIKPGLLGQKAAVTYSGPTYIAIRSGKHSTSTAYSHAKDIDRLLELTAFDPITRFKGIVKPIFIFTVDGGPDENPRYIKVINVAIHHFLQNNMDAIFIACNAPGRSAYNRVERRMAPLSRELAGVILPHDHFGTHLDSKLKTTDLELERINFSYAGQTLAEIWSKLSFDNYETKAEYIDPISSDLNESELLKKGPEWFSIHVTTSQYMTQIVKCTDESCCSRPRSNIFDVLKNRFLPPPVPIQQTDDGLKVAESKDINRGVFASLFLAGSLNFDNLLKDRMSGFKSIPHDMFCPSLNGKLVTRICKICQKYFSSLTILKDHYKWHKSTYKPDKVRPKRITATRGHEHLMVVGDDNMEAEWINQEFLESESVLPDYNSKNECESFPVFSVEETLSNLWENSL